MSPTLPFAHRLLAVTAAAPLLAQAPSAWTTLAAPAGIAASDVVSIGKVVTWRDGDTLHAWSAVVRRFDALPILPGSPTTLRVTNDVVLLQTPTQWFAYASHRPGFRPLTLGPGAVLWNAAGASNDSALLVTDAGQLHTFSGFVGAWSSRPLASSHQAAVQRHVAVVAAGSQLLGYEAFGGSWHASTASGSVGSLSADGTAAIATTATRLHAFSASRRQWQSHAVVPNATMERGDDWVLWASPTQLLGYSSHRGAFAALAHGATGPVQAGDLFALVPTTAGLVAFSALTGSWSDPLPVAVQTTALGGSTAVLLDATTAHAYSAVHNRFTPARRAATNPAAAGIVGLAFDATNQQPLLFSALSGRWHDAPTATPTTPVTLTTTAAGLLTPAGAVAFAGRSGDFVPLARPGLQLAGNMSSSPLLAYDQNELFAFDSRRETWLATPRGGSAAPQILIWRTAALVIEGNAVHGFGTLAGNWSSTTLPAPVTGWRINSESARLQTGSHLLAYSATGDLVTHAQFPEFRRVQPVGALLRVVLPLPHTSLAVLGAGRFLPTPVLLPNLGALHLDPNEVATLAVPAGPNGDPVTLELALPESPALLDLQLGCQAVVLPTSGQPWLTSATTVQLL